MSLQHPIQRATRHAHLARGLNVADGQIAYEPVARDLGMKYVKPDWLTSI